MIIHRDACIQYVWYVSCVESESRFGCFWWSRKTYLSILETTNTIWSHISICCCSKLLDNIYIQYTNDLRSCTLYNNRLSGFLSMRCVFVYLSLCVWGKLTYADQPCVLWKIACVLWSPPHKMCARFVYADQRILYMQISESDGTGMVRKCVSRCLWYLSARNWLLMGVGDKKQRECIRNVLPN